MSARPPQHAKPRLEADRFRTVESQLWNREATVAQWRIDHQAHPCSTVARQALFALCRDEPAKGLEGPLVPFALMASLPRQTICLVFQERFRILATANDIGQRTAVAHMAGGGA